MGGERQNRRKPQIQRRSTPCQFLTFPAVLGPEMCENVEKTKVVGPSGDRHGEFPDAIKGGAEVLIKVDIRMSLFGFYGRWRQRGRFGDPMHGERPHELPLLLRWRSCRQPCAGVAGKVRRHCCPGSPAGEFLPATITRLSRRKPLFLWRFRRAVPIGFHIYYGSLVIGGHVETATSAEITRVCWLMGPEPRGKELHGCYCRGKVVQKAGDPELYIADDTGRVGLCGDAT